MTTRYICDDCGDDDGSELELCVLSTDMHHCDECLQNCRPCRIDRAEDHAVQVALEIVRGKR